MNLTHEERINDSLHGGVFCLVDVQGEVQRPQRANGQARPPPVPLPDRQGIRGNWEWVAQDDSPPGEQTDKQAPGLPTAEVQTVFEFTPMIALQGDYRESTRDKGDL